MRQLGIFILWLLWRTLPYPVLGHLGDLLGRLLYPLASERRHMKKGKVKLWI